MLLHCFILVLYLYNNVESAVQNVTCPDVEPRELDWKELDGKWYLAASSSEILIQGQCAIVRFSHIKNNATEISISWVANNTVSYYNGSLAIIEDPKSNGTGDLLTVTYQDEKSETYSFLDVEYGHYAAMFACYNNDDGNSSTYELWKLSRTPHLKEDSSEKINKAIAKYNLEDTSFEVYRNTDDYCQIRSGGNAAKPSSLVMSSVAAITLFRRMY